MKAIEKNRIIPVADIKTVEEVLPLCNAVKNGGLDVIEITFRSVIAEKNLEIAVKESGLCVGAGTIINARQCKTAIGLGAKFIVGPGFSREVLEVCNANGIPYYPGCITPTEIIAAHAGGLNIVKFFPAESFGGVKALKALSAAFPNVKFIPTGGLSRENLSEYLALKSVYACGMSSILSDTPQEVEMLVREAVEISKKMSANRYI